MIITTEIINKLFKSEQEPDNKQEISKKYRLKPGRPKGSKAPRTPKPDHLRRSKLILGVRYTPEEADRLMAAIRESGESPSEWTRHQLLKTITTMESPEFKKLTRAMKAAQCAIERLEEILNSFQLP